MARSRPMQGMDRPSRSDLAVHWGLDPDTVFLNHGSFGATPLAIREEQRRWQDRMEHEPVAFLDGEGLEQMTVARQALASMLSCDADDLALVDNATSAVNTVLRSLTLQPGDELLVPDHAYQACRNALDFVAQRWDAKVVTVPIPFPVVGPEAVIDAVMEAVTDQTVLAMIDTVTSPTGLRMPFEALVAKLEGAGVQVLLDAAHGIGMVPLALDELGASYTTSNCHKWLCAPKGSAFLHVRKDRQHAIHPLTISHGASVPLDGTSRFRHEFDWTGTRDPSAHCALPATVEHVGGLMNGGWPAIMERNRALVLKGRSILCEALGIEPPCPESMVASIATLILPLGDDEAVTPHRQDPLKDALKSTYDIQVPVWTWASPRGRFIRISAQLYNTEEEYRYLAWALKQALCQ